MKIEAKMNDSSQPLDLIKLTIQFYEVIAKIKKLEQEGLLDNEVKRQLDLEKPPLPEETANAVQLLLLQWMEQTRKQYKDNSTETENYWVESTLYAVAALADEIMLINFDWPGKSEWQDMLLETSLFQSFQAGSTIFKHIDTLLKAQNHVPLDRQLAAVYLLILRLGFSGRYRDDPAKIAQYRQNLYRLVDKDASAENNPICHQAYKHLLVSKHQQRLAPISRWNRIMASIAAIYLLLGFIILMAMNANVSNELTQLWPQDSCDQQDKKCSGANK